MSEATVSQDFVVQKVVFALERTNWLARTPDYVEEEEEEQQQRVTLEVLDRNYYCLLWLHFVVAPSPRHGSSS